MLLAAAQERTNLAVKIVVSEEKEARTSKNNDWFRKAAEEMDIELDESLLDAGQGGGGQKDRQRLNEARRAKFQLAELLAKPMRKQHFGKFLGGTGAKIAAAMEGEVKPYLVDPGMSGAGAKKKKKKKGNIKTKEKDKNVREDDDAIGPSKKKLKAGKKSEKLDKSGGKVVTVTPGNAW